MKEEFQTSVSKSITIRLKINNRAGTLAPAISSIGSLGGNIGAIDLIEATPEYLIRDIAIETGGLRHIEEIVDKLNLTEGIEVIELVDRVMDMHRGGKIEVVSKTDINSREKLSMAYTPGVARVCMAIHQKPDRAYKYTIKKNSVAIVTDGTAVLGLGDIGPRAAMPVMEGKAMLFKNFANVDAYPICLDTKDTEEIIQTVKNIAPGFGGINLEDISAPRCFEIEERLRNELDIPVFHDDQHGTAVVFTAGIINALKIVKKEPEDVKVVIVGVGAAGTACTKMLMDLGVKNIIGFDRKGALHKKRTDLTEAKQRYAEATNHNNEEGSIHDVIAGADVFVGLSGPDIIGVEDLKKMNTDPIVFAMSNPDPEIQPEIALPHVAVMATGRSDYPNQINNVLCFPGIFRGTFDVKARVINEEMKMAAAIAIADCVKEDYLLADNIIPSVFSPEVSDRVAKAVAEAARKSGVAR